MVDVNKDDVLNIFEKCQERGKNEWGEIHKAFNEDKRFIQLGRQLSPAEEEKLKGRPLHIINKLLTLVKSVTNEMRQTEISGKFSPIDNGADKEKAEVRRGVVRAIERISNAQYAYQYGGEEAVTGGMGAWRVNKRYVSDMSFDQTLEVKRILDASCVTIGRMNGPCIEADFSDADWCIIEEKRSAAEEGGELWNRFKSNHKIKKDIWGDEDLPLEYEFWYCEKKKDTLYRFKTGRSILKSKLKEDQIENDELFILRNGKRLERETERKQWHCFKLSGRDYTEDPVKWEGKFCPIIICMGREVWEDGKRTLLSLCRYSKASQQLYNYARQEMARRLSQAAKAGWLAALESIPKNLRKIWDTAHEKVYSTLYYKSRADDGTLLPKPEIPQSPPLDPSLVTEAQHADAEIKDTSGIQAENLAMRSNATSRVAIDAKKQEGDTITYDFQDNQAIAIQHTNRVLNDLVPKVIDTERQIRMIGEDDAEKVVRVNAPYLDEKTGEQTDIYYLSEEEEYDVSVSIGPSYESKRQAAQESILTVMEKSPAAAIVMPHVWVKQLDFPWADSASKMLKKLLDRTHPGITEPDEDEDENEIQSRLMQAMQQNQQLQAQMAQLQEALQKSAADKNAAEAAKAQALIKNLEIERQKLNIEQDRKRAEYAFRKRELDIQMIEKDKSIKIDQQNADTNKFDAQTKRMSAKKKLPEPEKV